MTDRETRPAGTSIDRGPDRGLPHPRLHRRPLAYRAVYLALELGRPLLLEGEAGVGKTELAKVLAASLGTRLIRLQCYEGLDVNTAVYEWNYPRQMLEIRLLEARGDAEKATAHDIFSSDFLIRRPLLQALEADDGVAPVLLIDEIDRADEEFEAYLLEILSDFQVTVRDRHHPRRAAPARDPDVEPDPRGPRRAQAPLPLPLDRLSDGAEGVRDRVGARPGRAAAAREGVVGFVHHLREADLTKVPGIAETLLDWAAALLSLGAEAVLALVDETLGVVLKYEEDIRQIRGEQVARMLTEVAARG